MMDFETSISAIVLVVVFFLIAIRQVGSLKLQIWQIMLFGALCVALLGQISPEEAIRSVNLDVMIFLAGMFIIGEAMQESGYLLHLSNSIFQRAKNLDQLLLLILFGIGFLSALLMNDTLAIIGTPIVLYFARAQNISPKLLLLTLAVAVTTGSALSPIGNPQNLLIAVDGELANPFLVFIQYLFLPTVVNLLLAYLLLRFLFRDQFLKRPLEICQEQIADRNLASLAKISFILLILLIFAKMVAVLLGVGEEFRLTYIALISALPILLFSSRRLEVVRKIDWPTLVFFAAMFILMESVWKSGIFQSAMSGSQGGLTSVPAILVISVLLSQLISNVPFVALCLPLMVNPSAQELMALAAGSTIAGNLFILGAASNVII
ncbi:MAG: anion transporter, partial [Methanothrix sp.]|nr:anion transporter [Methanothrix sp.]